MKDKEYHVQILQLLFPKLLFFSPKNEYKSCILGDFKMDVLEW